jgi:hypothetical protein
LPPFAALATATSLLPDRLTRVYVLPYRTALASASFSSAQGGTDQRTLFRRDLALLAAANPAGTLSPNALSASVEDLGNSNLRVVARAYSRPTIYGHSLIYYKTSHGVAGEVRVRAWADHHIRDFVVPCFLHYIQIEEWHEHGFANPKAKLFFPIKFHVGNNPPFIFLKKRRVFEKSA